MSGDRYTSKVLLVLPPMKLGGHIEMKNHSHDVCAEVTARTTIRSPRNLRLRRRRNVIAEIQASGYDGLLDPMPCENFCCE